jgi:hypothetical protein
MEENANKVRTGDKTTDPPTSSRGPSFLFWAALVGILYVLMAYLVLSGLSQHGD